MLPVLFPDGRIPSLRWRRFLVAVLIVAAAMTVVAMFRPDPDIEGTVALSLSCRKSEHDRSEAPLVRW
jgi:hypothetical protein